MTRLVRESLILERQVSQISPKGVITSKYLDRIFSDSMVVNDFFREYDYDAYLEAAKEREPSEFFTKESEDLTDNPKFRNFVYDELEDKFYDIQNQFINEDLIDIWRALTVKNSEDWITHLMNQGKHLGIYWTYDEEFAEPHWGYDEKKDEVIIKSSVKNTHVNWTETFQANLHPILGDEEREITLFRGTPLKIESAEHEGYKLNIRSIKDKIFYA